MEDIKRVQLSEIVELITKGTTPTTLGYEFQDEGVNFLKIECFDENGGFIESKVAHISEECHKKMKRSQLKNGDILFSIAGAIGRVAIVTEEMLPANINQALAIIRISDGQVYLPYIKLILTSPIVIEQFERKKQGVAQLNLSLKDINEISIPLPSKDKQIELAELFDKVVGVILKRNKELSALDDLIKARFVEMFGSVNDTCEVGCYIKSLVAGKSFVGETECENKVLKTGAVSFDYFDASQVKNLPVDYKPQEEHLVSADDIIISRMNTAELTGAAAYVWHVSKRVYIPDRLWKAVLNEKCNPIFVWQMLIQPSTKKQIQRKCSGTSGSMKNISKAGMLSIKVKKVPFDMQNQFASFVKQVYKSKVVMLKILSLIIYLQIKQYKICFKEQGEDKNGR